jgi:nicotinamide-nucleotide amidase
MKAEIISVGTELTSGDSLNTNAKYIASALFELGIDVDIHISVKDDKVLLEQITESSLSRADIVIFTGGLGPTEDDFTKEIVAKVAKKEIIPDEKVLEEIESFFKHRNISMSKNNIKQSYVIENSVVLRNRVGTAPGYLFKHEEKIVVLLPGPPSEMKQMFESEVMPILRTHNKSNIYTKVVKCIGIGESQTEENIKHLINESNDVYIATYAKVGEVKIKLTSREKDNLEIAFKSVAEIMKDNIFAYSDIGIEQAISENLRENQLKIGFCESCTGGLVTSKMTELDGASEILDRSVITYSNKAKMAEADVKYSTIKAHGAVSPEVAIEMAEGLFRKSDIDISVSITGIAGPSGGSEEKPVGLVYIALSSGDGSRVKKNMFTGDRKMIQERATKEAYNIIREYLIEKEKYRVY